MSVRIRIEKLRDWSPFDNTVWIRLKKPITLSEVTVAIRKGRFNTDHSRNLRRKDHIERIAHLVVIPDPTPIVIDVGIPVLGAPNSWIVQDGNHRLAAAIYRCDETIEAEIYGQIGYAERLLDVKVPPHTSPALKHSVSSDGKTVWVNSSVDGGAIGRFGKGGIDIHREASQQPIKGTCLHCTHHRPNLEDWATFVAKMKELFGVKVEEEHKPQWLSE